MKRIIAGLTIVMLAAFMLILSVPVCADEENVDQAPSAAFRYFWQTVNNGQYAQSWAMLSSGSQRNFVYNLCQTYGKHNSWYSSAFSSDQTCREVMSEASHEMVRSIWQSVNRNFNGNAFLTSKIMTVKNDGQRAMVVSDCSSKGYLMINENGRWLVDFMH
ncbi:MAG: hypothetical protein K6G50_13800 [bacterium]|nr:hypothetical protein [bacterium]